jgi:hypothetical protein
LKCAAPLKNCRAGEASIVCFLRVTGKTVRIPLSSCAGRLSNTWSRFGERVPWSGQRTAARFRLGLYRDRAHVLKLERKYTRFGIVSKWYCNSHFTVRRRRNFRNGEANYGHNLPNSRVFRPKTCGAYPTQGACAGEAMQEVLTFVLLLPRAYAPGLISTARFAGWFLEMN